MVILLTADWHIKKDDRIFSHNPALTKDLEVAIDFLVNFIFENKIDAVLLAGDIFDSPSITAYGLELTKKFIAACKQKKTKIYFVQGQHDKSPYAPLLLTIDEYCQYVHDKVFHINSLPFYGLDFIHNPTEVGKEGHILLTHLIYQEFSNFLFGNITLKKTKSSVILTGDYHAYQIINSPDGKILVSPGPLVPQRLNQLSKKVCILFDQSLSFKELLLPQREYYTFSVMDDNDFSSIEKFVLNYKPNPQLPAAIRKPVIILEYDPEFFSDKDFDKFQEKFILFLRLKFKNKPIIYAKSEEIIDFSNSDIAIKIVDKLEINEDTKYLLKQFLKNEDLSPLEAFVETGYVQTQTIAN